MSRIDPPRGRSLMTAGRVAALKRMAPYAATLLVVTILLLVAFLRARAFEPSPTSDAVVPPASGWGSPGPTAAPVPTARIGSATTTAAPAPTGTRPVTTAPKKESQIVAWIRDLGLTGGGGSYQEAFIAELAWGQCAELRKDVDAAPADEVDRTTLMLYRTAAQACLAAFHGKRSLWPAADAGVEELSGRSSSLDCIDRAAYDLTRTLVRLHRANPDAVLRRGNADDADGPCPRVLSIEPSSGPADGGYEVRITGENLPDPAVIHFGDVTRRVPTSGGRSAVVAVPPVGHEYDVGVWVDGWPYDDMYAPTFTYDRPPSASTAVEESHGP